MSASSERILYEAHPAMFRNRPITFVLCVILSLVLIGLIPLLIWYLQSRGTSLIVTTEQTTLRRGILSKYTNDVFHENVRNIIVRQSWFQRMMGTGYVGISSSGQSGIEIEVNGIPDPDRVKELIDDCRSGRVAATAAS
jgi:uncharacterized membrane protein YdbT with pleckstrin-like domain